MSTAPSISAGAPRQDYTTTTASPRWIWTRSSSASSPTWSSAARPCSCGASTMCSWCPIPATPPSAGRTWSGEREIWQGAFTEVNLGCLTGWIADAGNADFSLLSHFDDGVMTMDVHLGTIVFHRFSVTTGEEIRPEEPWTVLLPHNPKTAPLRWEVRKAASKPPTWPNSAALSVEWADGADFRGFRVSFPEAIHREGAYMYTVEASGPDGRRLCYKEIFGEFWKMPVSERSGRVVFSMDDVFFSPGEPCRFMVRAIDFFGNAGTTLTATAKSPDTQSPWEVAWRSECPMSDMSFSSHNWGRDRRQISIGADGWLDAKTDMMSADLPAAAVPEPDPVGTEYRLVFTLEEVHASSLGNWILGVENAATGKAIRGSRDRARVLTPRGNIGPVPYAFCFKKTASGALPLRISFMYGGDGGRLSFSSARLERRVKR